MDYSLHHVEGPGKRDGHYPADQWPADNTLTVSEIKKYVMKYAQFLQGIWQLRRSWPVVKKGRRNQCPGHACPTYRWK